MQLTIGKLAAAGRVGVETVRYYQRRGLLDTPARSGGDGWGGIRRYGEDDLRRLKFIRSAQAAGFTLEEISELLVLEASDDSVRVRRLARERIEALDTKIAHMTETRAAPARVACFVGGCVHRYCGVHRGCPNYCLWARASGCSLAGFSERLALEAGNGRVRGRRVTRERIDALVTKIAQMTATRAALARIAALCAASDKGACPIWAAF